MSRPRYGYSSRRRRRQGRHWWLFIAFVPAVATLLLSLLLLDEDSGRLVASTSCDVGEDCASAVAAVAECANGGACDGSQGGRRSMLSTAPPDIAGQALAIIDEPCGALLYGRNAHQRSPPASLTKIATALVAFERTDPSEMVSVRVDGAELAYSTESTVMGLSPGQRLTMRDLLYGLLLSSGNDAALAIAEHVATSVPAFVDLMNDKIETMGLNDTQFTNPHGLDDPGLYTSAFDIAMLGRELLGQPELAAIVRTGTYQPAWDGPPVSNGNLLLELYPESLGVKNGYTDQAGQTIVAVAERGGRRLIVSVLGSINVYQDVITLFDWAFTSAPSTCR